ncbi:MAG: hypothetical protein GY710_02165 [Desulfobacteraceae bacterium]|nr:hypothetical protein [Desulfobacteraceae bacterium]
MFQSAYEIQRNELIDEAWELTKKELKDKGLTRLSNEIRNTGAGISERYKHYFFVEFFHNAMNRLAYEKGLVLYCAAR